MLAAFFAYISNRVLKWPMAIGIAGLSLLSDRRYLHHHLSVIPLVFGQPADIADALSASLRKECSRYPDLGWPRGGLTIGKIARRLLQ